MSGGRCWCGWVGGERRGVAEECACVCRQSPGDGVGSAASDYLVGQVADSLQGGPRPPGSGTGRLAALFCTAEPSAPPVFVSVPQVSRRATP